ncbi:hypothetical protein ACFYVR_13125 [Rhodococcus sp. NPDC003318]|uniref:hypothetical protein n=1 Tax=Rhodococcus sp. NPDC003318 TaxID=3364503 RepID=UPI0036930125
MAVFAVGASSAVPIANFTATGLSLVCLALVPAFLLMAHRGADLVPLVLAALGWLSFIASGIVNHVSILWPNSVAPAAFSLYLIGLAVITGRTVDAIACALAGIAAGTTIFFLFRGIELTRTGSFLDMWKYGIAQAVTILLLFGIIKSRTMSRLSISLALVVLGACSLALNYRAHALVCLISGAVLGTRAILGSRISRGWQFGGIAILGIVFAYAMPIAGRLGWFGPALQHKTVEQQATGLHLLLAGRTESPMLFTAILDRPILGWGSAQRLTPEVYTAAEHLAVRMGFAPTFPFAEYWRLPPQEYSAMHSVVLGSWAEGGVLAVLLPVWVLVACLALVWNCDRYGRWAPLVVVVSVQGVWDLFYEPWNYNSLPVYACIALFFLAGHFSGRTLAHPPP